MRHVAEASHQDLESIYTAFGWPLYRKYGHAYEGMKLALKYVVCLYLLLIMIIILLPPDKVSYFVSLDILFHPVFNGI